MRPNDLLIVLFPLGLVAALICVGLTGRLLGPQRRRLFARFVLIPVLALALIALSIVAITERRWEFFAFLLVASVGIYWHWRQSVARPRAKPDSD